MNRVSLSTDFCRVIHIGQVELSGYTETEMALSGVVYHGAHTGFACTDAIWPHVYGKLPARGMPRPIWAGIIAFAPGGARPRAVAGRQTNTGYGMAHGGTG
jgi:hypothetical protein